MSYESEKLLPVSDKIFLLNLNQPTTHSNWISYESGIWYYTLSPASPYIADAGGGDSWSYSSMSAETFTVISFSVGIENYTAVNSFANLRSTNKSFYWIQSTQTLYVHFSLNKPYYMFDTMALGLASGYANKSFYNENDVYYEGLIKSVPNISMSKDPLFFGLFSYDGGTVTLSNVEGEFDDWIKNKIFGLSAIGQFGFADVPTGQWPYVFKMYVEDFSFNHREAQINIQDKRKSFSQNISSKVFDSTTYPYIGDNDENKPIPLPWGNVRNAPVVVQNRGDTGASNYVIRLCDTTYHNIKSGQTPVVYIDGTSVAVSNFSNTAGTCTIATGDSFDPDKSQEVTADFIGQVNGSDVSITNGQDVIKDIIETYLNIDYNTDTFNTTEWEAEESNTYDVSLFIDEETKIRDVIEKICVANLGIFLVQNDGKFTFRTYDENREVSQYIKYDELMGDGQYPDLEVDFPSEEYLTDCVVKYDKEWNSGKYKRVINDTYKSEVYAETGVYNSIIFETILTNSSDATSVSEKIMLRSKDIVPTITGRTMNQSMALEIMQFVQIETDGSDRTFFGEIIAEVIGFDKDTLTGEVSLTLKYVKDAPPSWDVIYDGGDATFTFWDVDLDGGDAPLTNPHTIFADGGNA